MNQYEIGTKRHLSEVAYSQYVQDNLEFRGSIKHEEKTGVKLTGTAFGGFRGALLPEQINTSHDQFELGGRKHARAPQQFARDLQHADVDQLSHHTQAPHGVARQAETRADARGIVADAARAAGLAGVLRLGELGQRFDRAEHHPVPCGPSRSRLRHPNAGVGAAWQRRPQCVQRVAGRRRRRVG